MFWWVPKSNFPLKFTKPVLNSHWGVLVFSMTSFFVDETFFSAIVTKKIWYCSHHLFHWNYEKLSGLSEKKFQAKQKNRKYWFILWKNTRSQWLILNLFAALTLILIFTNLYLSLLQYLNQSLAPQSMTKKHFCRR